MRGLQNAKQYGCPDRTDRRNLAELFPGLVFLGLCQQLPPHFLTHRPQLIELLVVKTPPAGALPVRRSSRPTRHDGAVHRPACRYKEWPNYENPTATTREIPRDGADSIRDNQP